MRGRTQAWAWICQSERMQNLAERKGTRQAVAVIGASVVLLVVTTVLLVPHEGWGVCSGTELDGSFTLGSLIGFGVQLGSCSTAWTSLVGIPTGYVLWGGVQLVVIAAALAVQASLLSRGGRRIR